MIAQSCGSHVSSFGGYVEFGDPEGQPKRVDVGRWELDQKFFMDDTTNTGCSYGQGVNITCRGGVAVADIIWDNNQIPDSWLTAQGDFDQGVEARFILGDGGYNAFPDYYWMPNAKVLNLKPIVDSNNKKVVRYVMTLISNGDVFHMPYDSELYTAYNNNLNQIGRSAIGP